MMTLIAAKPPGLSGLAYIAYQIDSGAWQTTSAAQATVTIDGSGEHTVRAYAVDHAGNVSPVAQASALIDETPPSGVFEPISPTNPRNLVVDVADAASGVSGGNIELDVGGQWRSIPTRFDGQHLVGFVNDDTLPRGYWPARAIVSDAVGNTAIVNAFADGTAVVVPIPIRLQTQVLAGNATKEERNCVVKRVSVRGRPRHGHRRSRLVVYCSSRSVPAPRGLLRLNFGQLATISGLAQTVSHQPLAHVQILVHAHPPQWRSRLVATLTTSSSGRFTYRLRGGPTRTLTFTFPGTATLHDSSAKVQLAVRGAGTLRVAGPLRAGRRTRFAGRVLGDYIPPGGKIVQLQYRSAHGGRWRLFGGNVYTGQDGRWEEWLTLASAGYTYEFRALLPRQADWPFLASATGVITRTIR